MWSEEKAAAAQGLTPPAQVASASDVTAVGGSDGGQRAAGAATQAASLPDGLARLYLNLGRKDGAGDGQIRDLLREHAGVTAVPEIDVMNTHTYLNVASADADRICSALTGKQIADRDLVCERARPRR